MGDQYKCILILLQIAFQPCDMLCIEIVRRLIQKEYIRFFQQKLCQKNFHTLSAA